MSWQQPSEGSAFHSFTEVKVENDEGKYRTTCAEVYQCLHLQLRTVTS